MGELIEVKVDKTMIWMETEDATAEEVPQRVSKENMVEKALQAGESLHKTIKGYCSSLVKAIESFEDVKRPNKVTAEFGLRLSGDCKFYVVNTSGEASLKITAEWTLE